MKVFFVFLCFLLQSFAFAQFTEDDLVGTWIIDVAASEKMASREDKEQYFKGEFLEIFKTLEYEFFKENGYLHYIRYRKPVGKPVVSTQKIYCKIYQTILTVDYKYRYNILEFNKDKIVLEFYDKDSYLLHSFFIEKIVLKRKK